MNAVCEACEKGDIAKVKELLSSGHDVNAQANKWGWPPIFWAVYGQHNSLVEYLCNSTKCNPNKEDIYGKTALHVACKNGNIEVVRFLLSRGADVNYKSTSTRDSWTPLMYAAKYGWPEICRYLIMCGANLDVVDYENKSAYDLCSDDETRDSLRDTDPLYPSYPSSSSSSSSSVISGQNNYSDENGMNNGSDVLICYCAANGNDGLNANMILNSLLEFSISCALLPSTTDFTLAVKSLRKSSIVIVVLSDEFASDTNASCRIVNSADGMGKKITICKSSSSTVFPPSGLLGMLFAGQLYQDISGQYSRIHTSLMELAKTIEKNLVEITSGNSHTQASNNTPAPTAASQSLNERDARDRRRRQLANIKFDPAKTKKSGFFARGGCVAELTEASKSGDVEKLRSEIHRDSFRASVNLCDGDVERTPLLHACAAGHFEIVKILISDFDANIYSCDRRGNSALSFAASGGFVEIVTFLVLNAGMNVNFLPPLGMPALHHAAKENQLQMVRILLELGAKKTLADHLGRQAIDFAQRNHEISQLLSKKSMPLYSEVWDKDIFISYQWNQQSQVISLADQIRKQCNLSVWQDIGQMQSGDSLFYSISKGIYSAEVIVFAISPAYCNSINCLKEVSLCRLLKKKVIPVYLEEGRELPTTCQSSPMSKFLNDLPTPPLHLYKGEEVMKEFYTLLKYHVEEEHQRVLSSYKSGVKYGVFSRKAHQFVTDGKFEELLDYIQNDKDCDVDVDARDDEYHWTLLMHSCCQNNSNNFEIARLLATLSNINLVDNQGKSALHIACKHGNVKIAEMLIEKGCNISFIASGFKYTTESIDYWSPGMYAVDGGHVDVVSLLLRNGVDPHQRNEKLRSMISIAEEKGNTEILNLLNSSNLLTAGLSSSSSFPNNNFTIEQIGDRDVVLVIYHHNWRKLVRNIVKRINDSDMASNIVAIMDEGQFDQEKKDDLFDKFVSRTKKVIVICSESIIRDDKATRQIILASDKKKTLISLVPSKHDFPPQMSALSCVLSPHPFLLLQNGVNNDTSNADISDIDFNQLLQTLQTQ